MGECLTGHIPTNKNPADIVTKVLPGRQKCNELTSLVLYDLCDDHLMSPGKCPGLCDIWQSL